MRLWIEFVAFYVAAPLLLAVALPPDALFAGLVSLTAIGVVLLGQTPGFRWSELLHGAGRISPSLAIAFTAGTAAVSWLVMQATSPSALLVLPREMPGLMLMIVALYPLLSALPQELVFRPLFFRRYGPILPASPRGAIVLNAALFSAAHLVYWNWAVAAMTFAGGLMFAWSYRVRGNFPEAVVLHSLAGLVVFAIGLGEFFYSGNIRRPF